MKRSSPASDKDQLQNEFHEVAKQLDSRFEKTIIVSAPTPYLVFAPPVLIKRSNL